MKKLTITDKEFDVLRRRILSQIGVSFKDTKKPLVIARMRKRLEELNFDSFTEYIAVLEDPEKKEMEYFVNALTTNETNFFRHKKQFNRLYDRILPTLFDQGRSGLLSRS